MYTPDVLFETLPNQIGLITLNRPNQLNALNHAMCVDLCDQLTTWATSDKIKAVVIRGAGERAFCAGGDIRAIYELRNQPNAGTSFFSDEYRLNKIIHYFPKPYIALMDGIAMGGGLGASIHGTHRIATEKLKLAMPETGIGFFTDVGATYFLSRCPGSIGEYLGLTGNIINAADAQQIGLIDAMIYSQKITALLDALVKINWSENPHALATQCITSFASPVIQPELEKYYPIIQGCFSHETVEEIIIALLDESDSWAQQTAALLQTRSPTSLKIVLAALRRGRTLDFDACMQMEYQLATRFLAGHDFYEGIRAAVVDKDRLPKWDPATLKEVSDEVVDGYFVKTQ